MSVEIQGRDPAVELAIERFEELENATSKMSDSDISLDSSTENSL